MATGHCSTRAYPLVEATSVIQTTRFQSGGTNPIPVESIRLKRIRDAREDYEYLRTLEDAGERVFRHEHVFAALRKSEYRRVRHGHGLVRYHRLELDADASDDRTSKARPGYQDRERSGPATLLTLAPRAPSAPPLPPSPSARPNPTRPSPARLTAWPTAPAPRPSSTPSSCPAVTPSGSELPTPRATPIPPRRSAPGRWWNLTTVYQADGLIKRSGDYRYKGNNVYNLTGSNQTWKLTALARIQRTFLIRVQNDGEATDSFSIVGSKVNGFTTKYFFGAREHHDLGGGGRALYRHPRSRRRAHDQDDCAGEKQRKAHNSPVAHPRSELPGTS